MKKLLHERLREWAGEDCYAPAEIIVLRDACFEAARDAFLMMADEIERYYIPRPRFEDGEPVQFGDKALRWDGKHGNDGENVVSITIEGGDYLRYGFNGDICSSEPFKRPSPKVLDTDGVEIKVGDTVWSKGEAEYIVEEIKDEDHIHLRRPYEDKALVKMTARCLTHKEPDSMEKLRDDMHKEWLIGFEIGKEKARDWSDRLSALIEKVD